VAGSEPSTAHPTEARKSWKMSRKIDAAGNGALSISFVTRSRWKSHSWRRRGRTATQRELPGEIGTQREQADGQRDQPHRLPEEGPHVGLC
jgi:hypothetical protein